MRHIIWSPPACTPSNQSWELNLQPRYSGWHSNYYIPPASTHLAVLYLLNTCFRFMALAFISPQEDTKSVLTDLSFRNPWFPAHVLSHRAALKEITLHQTKPSSWVLVGLSAILINLARILDFQVLFLSELQNLWKNFEHWRKL